MAGYKKEKYNDLGLGPKGYSERVRALNKDGTFNVYKTNIPFFERINIFHSLITMSWMKFFTLIFLYYIMANLIFASAYVIIGVDNLTGMEGLSRHDQFIEAFFFSAQTLTTLGYGRVAPVGMATNIVAAIESMMGLLAFAVATGMLYGRFSNPTSKIKYSNHGVIAPFQNINGFMFRVVNPQENQLLEVEVSVTLSMQREHTDLRDYFLLDLERQKVVVFPSVWTIVHPITDSSPLYGLTEADFYEKDVEFIIMMKAFDESFSQTVYSRSSYKASEVRWGEKFVYLIKQEKNGISVDISRMDETEKAALN
jgi:inward rectifier potassium channel